MSPDKSLVRGASQTTVNRELQILRRAYRLAALETEPPKIERVPRFLITKENNARKVFITSEQLEKLRQAASQEGLWVRVLIELAYMLGWRRGELISLRVRDVNIPERAIRLQTSKNAEPRECPLTEGLAMLLQQLISGRHADDTLFPFHDIRGAWRRTCKRAGIPVGRKDGITFHDFRRTSARSKRAGGVDSSVIMKMQGWLTEGQFRRYGIVAPEDQLAAMHKQSATLFQAGPHHPATTGLQCQEIGCNLHLTKHGSGGGQHETHLCQQELPADRFAGRHAVAVDSHDETHRDRQ